MFDDNEHSDKAHDSIRLSPRLTLILQKGAKNLPSSWNRTLLEISYHPNKLVFVRSAVDKLLEVIKFTMSLVFISTFGMSPNV